ncbi:MAG: hypothetical protein UU37_C0003G0002 [Candidatus Gottesmanbacteria bacterium GW2011_GWA2_41_12]|uniref:Uncharacterized protein n=2 Tax=Candidatus Gottesmaniibacteriota TaxID=1752720 RepID=A0A0G0UHW8_9BACT|nr:MAG: hypothetical protein UT63_C0014G0013 [Candidatus Gottesmanbacteria bacterium GW2011_GWC2_39_8]KKR88428.1 MAG: hypothetical protein UU37_C0003G0002 [Candidatus Gottesmanbacteria bacterium GW2011_GWA2_41_12]
MFLSKKLLLLLFFFFLSSSFFITKIFAAEDIGNNSSNVSSYVNGDLDSIYEEQKEILRIKRENKKDAFSKGGMGSYNLTLVQTALLDSLVCMPNNPKPNCQTQAALPFVQKAIAELYLHPPADFIAWTGYELNKIGLAPKAYAQGIGIPGLVPLLPLWTALRNISYLVLVIIMVAIGFMIIFRMKIDPKTVISVQAALPKIITTLLLITFSYAIAGFMVDLMYLLMLIIITVFAKAGGMDVAAQQAYYTTGGFFHLGAAVMGGQMILGGWWNALMAPALGLAGILAGGGAIGGGITGSLGGTLGLGLGSTPFSIPVFAALAGLPLLLLLIVILGLLFTFIRIFMLLLNAYIQIIISVIFAPIQILPEAIPGHSAFSGWFRNLAAQLISFPTTVGILMLGTILVNNKGAGSLWTPPLIGYNIDINGAPPTTGAAALTNANPIAAFIGLGIIFSAPALIVSIKKLFQPKPFLPIGMGTALAPITGAAQTTMGVGQSFYYGQAAFGPILGKLGLKGPGK